jgi:hypothetical protein
MTALTTQSPAVGRSSVPEMALALISTNSASIYSHLSEDYELRNAGKLNDAFKKIVAKRLPEEGK